jgi:hypothetical protein
MNIFFIFFLRGKLILSGLFISIILFVPTICKTQNLLSAPQKIVIDSKRNRCLVSNYRTGSIVQIDSVGNQSYFKQDADFVDGMEIVGDTVYGVGDSRKINAYNLVTNQLVMSFTISGSSSDYLSSITSDSSGHLFISCPLLNTIYKMRISDQSYWVFAKDNGLISPNGILLEKEKNRIVVIEDSPSPSRIHAISLTDSTVSTLVTTTFNRPDGIVKDKNGSYYVGGFFLPGIYRFDSDFRQPPQLFFQGNNMVYPTYNGENNSLLITYYSANDWDTVNIYSTPNMPTMFEVNDSSTGILLRWKNPSQYSDGTPSSSAYYILIYRDGILLDSLNQSTTDTGQIKTYFDIIQGYHIYRIRLRDSELAANYSVYSDSLLGYGGIPKTNYNENFENGKGLIYRTGMWDTTRYTVHGGLFSFADSPSENTNTYFILPPIVVTDACEMVFYHNVMLSSTDTAYVEISKDKRKTFSILKKYYWSSGTNWQGGYTKAGDWRMEKIGLTSYLGNTVTIRFRLLSQDTKTTGEGWYVDDITVDSYEINLNVNARWNMLSIPLEMKNNQLAEVFPSSRSEAFFYEPDSRKYYSEYSLARKKAYWLKFHSVVIVAVQGERVLSDTFNVKAGWNMIGSISVPVPVTSISSEPAGIRTSKFFSYQAGYIQSDTIKPGIGYWVNVNQTGKLILSASPLLLSTNRIKINLDEEQPPAPPIASQNIKTIPEKFQLDQNYPNPFNPVTTIKFDVPVISSVRIEVINVNGIKVRTIIDERKEAGSYTAIWDGNDEAGVKVSSGIYFFRLIGNGFTLIRKAVLLK